MNKWVYVAVGLRCQVVPIYFFFRAGIYSHLAILEVPPAEHKRSGDKMPNQL